MNNTHPAYVKSKAACYTKENNHEEIFQIPIS
jgi:hypothetical protein